jgi:hypothetical protein
MLTLVCAGIEGFGQYDSLSVWNILKNPALLKGKTSAQVRAHLVPTVGWSEETLGRGRHKGQGWVFREHDADGIATGRLIRWHPGSTHHGEKPYWVVSSPKGGKVYVFDD